VFQISDDFVVRRGATDGVLLLLLELLDVGFTPRGGFRERRGGHAELVLEVRRA